MIRETAGRRATPRPTRQKRVGKLNFILSHRMGLGLAAVPEWLVADALVASQLMRVLDRQERPSSGIHAVYSTNRLLASRARLFVDHLARDPRQRGLPR